MTKIAKFLFLLLVSIFSINVSVKAKTSVELESYLRKAWNAKDCRQADTLLNEMSTVSSQAVYYFYQAEALEFGHCTEKNVNKAIAAYQRAYNISQSLGAMQIGSLYLNNKNDPETAQKWFRMIAVLYGAEERRQIETEDRYRISEAVKELFIGALFGDREFPEVEFEKALKWAHELKNSEAKKIFEQALMFENGLNGYPRNEKAFNKLLHLAERQDYPQAAWRVAQRLLDEVQAGKRSLYHPLSSLKIAAHGGIVDAQVQVARTYRDINKKQRDLERAYSWFVYARKNGANIDAELVSLLRRIGQAKAEKIRNDIEQNGKIPQ